MDVLVLTASTGPADALPALDLLSHTVRIEQSQIRGLLASDGPDIVLVDARSELAEAKATLQLLKATAAHCPVLAVVTEDGLAAIGADWPLDDIVLTTAGPAEVEARLRLARPRRPTATSGVIRVGVLTVHPERFAALLDRHQLELTHKEFQLLHHLARHPGRVFTRDQLLRAVWGYAYFGGSRTVDVHVRRLRAKLGSEHASMICTVRRVGYTFVAPPSKPPRQAAVDRGSSITHGRALDTRPGERRHRRIPTITVPPHPARGIVEWSQAETCQRRSARDSSPRGPALYENPLWTGR